MIFPLFTSVQIYILTCYGWIIDKQRRNGHTLKHKVLSLSFRKGIVDRNHRRMDDRRDILRNEEIGREQMKNERELIKPIT